MRQGARGEAGSEGARQGSKGARQGARGARHMLYWVFRVPTTCHGKKFDNIIERLGCPHHLQKESPLDVHSQSRKRPS